MDQIKNLVVTTTYLENKEGEIITVIGSGFIVNEQYLATCYHNYWPAEITKPPIRIVVSYNFRPDRNELISDSAEIDLNYKYQPGQYDFSKHKYVDKKYETDFIVLKINAKIESQKPEFNFQFLPKYAQLGLVAWDNVRNGIFKDNPFFLFNLYIDNDHSSYRLGMISAAKAGYSGAPVYDIDNKIVSMVQYGDYPINLELLNALSAAGFLTMDDIKHIQAGYLGGMTISYGMNIKFLIETYLKGFLHD